MILLLKSEKTFFEEHILLESNLERDYYSIRFENESVIFRKSGDKYETLETLKELIEEASTLLSGFKLEYCGKRYKQFSEDFYVILLREMQNKIDMYNEFILYIKGVEE